MKRVSDEAVKKATGKAWDEWFLLVDAFGAEKMTHKEIASYLHDHQLAGAWWAQMVTVEYEKARGRRILGETADLGFEIGVHKTVSQKLGQVWEIITSPAGQTLWLGPEVAIPIKSGQTYEASNGTRGEIRTLKLRERIRYTWQPKGWPQPSTVQLTLASRPTGTRIGFHQEKLASAKEREEMRTHWRQIITKLASLIRN